MLYQEGEQSRQAISMRKRRPKPLSKGAAMAAMVVTSAFVAVPGAHAEGAQVIEEVVVTARKPQETLQEIPVVVNVITEDTINAQRIEGLKDIGSIVPGMTASKTISGTSGVIYLRGIGTGASNPTFDQTVSINLDGVGINSAQMMQAGMFDLRQIEVLRGPQALFFGKNSPGGVIAIHTNDPGDEFELELTGAYETTAEEPTLRGIISGPLTDTLGARVSFGWSKTNAGVVDVFNSDIFETGPTGDPIQIGFDTPRNSELETIFGTATLLWEPADNFSAKLKYSHFQDNQDGTPYDGIQRIWCGLGDPQVLRPVAEIDNCRSDGDVITPGFNQSLLTELRGGKYADYTGDGLFENRSDFAVLELNYEMDNGLTFTSVTGWFDNDELRLADASFQAVAGLVTTQEAGLRQYTQELRMFSNFDGNLNFALGFFYEDKEILRDTDVVGASNFVGVPVAAAGLFPINFGRQIGFQESDTYSLFGQVNWDITDQVALSAGGRWSNEEKENTLRAIAGGFDVDVPLADPDVKFDNFSPEVTLSYQLNDDVLFFASYRSGFKSGGFDTSYKPSELLPIGLTPGATFQNLYDEEEVDGFEIGMKSTLLDGRLRLNLTAYSFEYEDLQLSRFASDSSGALSFRVINAAKSSIEGLEIETFWVTPLEGLTLTANVAIANSEFDEYLADCFTGQTIALGCDDNPDPVTGNFTGAELAGENLPFATDLSANLGLTYDTRLTGNWNLGLNLTARYQDDYNQSSEFIPQDARQDSYWWLNAAVSVYSSDDTWELYVRGVNLSNEYFNVSAAGAPFSGNGATTGTNDPSGLPDFISYVTGGRQITFGMTYRM